VYTRHELEQRVRNELHLSSSIIRKLSKKELCARLNIPYHDSPPKPVVTTSTVEQKSCTRKRSRPRYTLEEVRTLALQRHLVDAKNVKKHSYFDLCRLLKLPIDENVNVPPPAQNCIERSSRALRHHQLAVVNFLTRHRGLIAFHKVGSGKTLTAITASQCYLDAHPTNRVIVITPAGLLKQFQTEMTQKYVNIRHQKQYLFFSYQKFTSLSKNKKAPTCHNAMVIIDEGHNLRNTKGINVFHVFKCTDKADKILILTGTPLYNAPHDIVALYNMIKSPHEPIMGTTVSPQSFKKLMCKISYHDTSGDPNFPQRHDVYEYIDMTKHYQKKYEQLLDAILNAKISSIVIQTFGDKDLVAFFNAVRRAVNNLDNTDENKKLHWVVQKIQHIPRHEKIVVFSNFLSAGIYLIANKLPPHIRYAIIDGSVPMKIRHDIVQDFNQDKIQVLFISKAGGEGLDMKGVRHVILMEPTWNEASIEQVIGRAIRYQSHSHLPKEQQSVTIHHLLHIFPTDRKLFPPIESYYKTMKKDPFNDNPEYPISPYESSFDLFLDFYIKKKQIRLDAYNEILQKMSIEQNTC
jgi:SNF2 family DNA or RNA helicase